MKMSAEVVVHLNSERVRGDVRHLRRDIVEYIGKDAQAAARRNVAPGVGPGPHPHPTRHVDTGHLRDSIHVEVEDKGNATDVSLYSTEDYGLFLELGWHTRSGTFYRYPWMWPAVEEASAQYEQKAKELARVSGF